MTLEATKLAPGGPIATTIRALEIAARSCNLADRAALEGAARLIRRLSLELSAARIENERLTHGAPRADRATAELEARVKAQEQQITRLHWELNAEARQQKRDEQLRAREKEIAQLKDQVATLKGERKPVKRGSTMPKIDPVEPSAQEQAVLDKRAVVKAELDSLVESGRHIRGGLPLAQKARASELNAQMVAFKPILKVFAKERQARYLAAQAAAMKDEATREIAQLPADASISSRANDRAQEGSARG